MTDTKHPGDIVFRNLTLRVGTAVRPGGGWFVNNAGWVIGDRETLVIDSFASELRTMELLAAVRAARLAAGTAETPWSLVLTHAHGDHANGAGLLEAAGATAVFAAAAAGEELLTHGIQTYPGFLAPPTWGAVSAPTRVSPLAGTEICDLGGVEVEVTTLPGPAHSTGDLVARLPADRILFTGDLVWGTVTPLAISGSVTGWLDQLDLLAWWGARTVVPGHGLIGGPELIDSTRRYLDWIVSLAQEVIAGAELSAKSLMRRRAGLEWDGWSCPERDLANVRRAVSDIDGRAYDVTAAMVDMRDSWGGLIQLQP